MIEEIDYEESNLNNLYMALVNLLLALKKERKTRETAIVITELEKTIAYFKVFVIDKL